MEHQGLVEEELKLAQELIDVHLGAPSFKLENVEAAQFLRNFDCHEDFKADNGHNEDDEVRHHEERTTSASEATS